MQKKRYGFGPFVLDLPERYLWKDEARVRILRQQIDLLVFFVQNPDRLISKDELLRMWPDGGIDVDEGSMQKAVRLLGRILGDTRRHQTYIQTVPRQGYRWICPVKELRELDMNVADVKEWRLEPSAQLDLIRQLRDMAHWHEYTASRLQLAASVLDDPLQFKEHCEVLYMLTPDQRAVFFFDLAQKAKANSIGRQAAGYFDALEAAGDNLRATLDYYHTQPTGRTLELEMSVALGRFWQVSGRWSEGAELLSRALAAHNWPSPLRAQALFRLGTFACSQAKYDEAKRLLTESVTLSRAVEDKATMGLAFRWLAIIAEVQGRYSDAKQYLYQSIDAGKECDSLWTIAHGVGGLGCVAEAEGDWLSAKPHYSKYLSITKELQDISGMAAAYLSLGVVAREEANYAGARKCYDQALPMMGLIRNKWGIADCHFRMGLNEEAAGRYTDAESLFRQSLDLHRETGDRLCQARAMEGIARINATAGNEKNSAVLFGAADAIRSEFASPLSPAERKNYGTLLSTTKQKFLLQWNEGKKTKDI